MPFWSLLCSLRIARLCESSVFFSNNFLEESWLRRQLAFSSAARCTRAVVGVNEYVDQPECADTSDPTHQVLYGLGQSAGTKKVGLFQLCPARVWVEARTPQNIRSGFQHFFYWNSHGIHRLQRIKFSTIPDGCW